MFVATYAEPLADIEQFAVFVGLEAGMERSRAADTFDIDQAGG